MGAQQESIITNKETTPWLTCTTNTTARQIMLAHLLHENFTTETTTSVQFYRTLLRNSLTMMDHGPWSTNAFASRRCAFTVPKQLESIQVKQGFEKMTRGILIEFNRERVQVAKDAMKILQVVYDAAETGQVSCTPSKEGTTYKLESPVGVNANLFTRNFEAIDVDD